MTLDLPVAGSFVVTELQQFNNSMRRRFLTYSVREVEGCLLRWRSFTRRDAVLRNNTEQSASYYASGKLAPAGRPN
jgi:hypothetical protein